MSNKMIFEKQKECDYGTKEYFRYDLMGMVNSVFCYNNYNNDYDKYLNNRYIQDYYLDKSYCDGKGRLTKEEVEEVVKIQVDYLVKHAKVKRNVGVDNEGVVYNSLIFDNEVQ